jgi:hypothetical protein
LMDGFQTRLTGLTNDEARCLLLVGQPHVAHRLGLGAPTRTAGNKLLNAIPPALAEEADRLSSWFLHDPDPWAGNHIPHGELRRLARSIQNRRKIEISVADHPVITVRPLGLVLKEGSWNLIVARDDSIVVVCIDQLRATRLTVQSFTPPVGFDLATFWRLHVSPVGGSQRERRRRVPPVASCSTQRRRRAAALDAP